MWYQKRGSKFGNVKQTYKGYNYMSKKEARRAFELDLMYKAGEIKGYERQFKIPLDVNGYHIANYFLDFRVFNNDGTETWEEVKGFETETWKMKWRLTEALFGDDPNIKLVVIK